MKNKIAIGLRLEVALTGSAELLTEQRLFLLDDRQWATFVAALDAPVKPRPRLEALLREPGVFD